MLTKLRCGHMCYKSANFQYLSNFSNPLSACMVMADTKLLLALRHDQGWIQVVRIDGRWGMSSFLILNEETNIPCFIHSSFTQYQMKTRLNNFSYLSWSLKKCMPMTISRHTSPMLARYSNFLNLYLYYGLLQKSWWQWPNDLKFLLYLRKIWRLIQEENLERPSRAICSKKK